MVRLFILILGVLVLEVAGSARLEAQSPAPASVGIILPLSGAVAPIGESIRNGIVFAQQELDLAQRIRFLFDDDQFQPAKTVAAFRRFADAEKVSGLLVFGMGQGFAVNMLAEQVKTPLIVIGIDPRLAEGKNFVMRFFPSIDTIFQALLKEVHRRGYRSLALAATAVDAMLALKERFEKEAPGLVVYSESFLPDERDFSAAVARIRKSEAEAVGLLLMPPQVSAFARQLREKQFPGKIFGAHPMENQAEFSAAQGALDDSWFVSAAVTADPTFFDRYSRQFPGAPEHYASMGYDIGKLFIQGIGSAEGLNTFLHTAKDFHGAIGTYSATGRNDFELPVEVRTGAQAIANWTGNSSVKPDR